MGDNLFKDIQDWNAGRMNSASFERRNPGVMKKVQEAMDAGAKSDTEIIDYLTKQK